MRKLLILLIVFIFQVQAQDYKPGDHELFLMPTAYTMPVKTSYFSNYELVFLNYTMAVSPSTHIGAFTLLPVVASALESFTLGIKQNYFSEEIINMAAFATYTPKISGFALGNVFSIGVPKKSMHLAVAYTKGEGSKKGDWIFMLGGRLDFSDNVSGIIEYSNLNGIDGSKATGILNFGVRVRSTKIAWEFSAIRPLYSTGDLIFWPFVKATYYFDGK